MVWWRQWRFCFLILFAVLGILRGIFWQPTIPFNWLNYPVSVCGTVGFPSTQHDYGASVVLKFLKLNDVSQSGGLKLFVPRPYPHFKRMIHVGDRYCLNTAIQPILNFGIPGEFDQERYFLSRGIWGTLK